MNHGSSELLAGVDEAFKYLFIAMCIASLLLIGLIIGGLYVWCS